MGQYLEYLTIDFFGLPLDESLSIPKRFLYMNLNHCLWIELLQMNNKSMRVAKFIHFVSCVYLFAIHLYYFYYFFFLVPHNTIVSKHIQSSLSSNWLYSLQLYYIHYNYIIFCKYLVEC